jgi:hypothetical protein
VLGLRGGRKRRGLVSRPALALHPSPFLASARARIYTPCCAYVLTIVLRAFGKKRVGEVSARRGNRGLTCQYVQSTTVLQISTVLCPNPTLYLLATSGIENAASLAGSRILPDSEAVFSQMRKIARMASSRVCVCVCFPNYSIIGLCLHFHLHRCSCACLHDNGRNVLFTTPTASC